MEAKQNKAGKKWRSLSRQKRRSVVFTLIALLALGAAIAVYAATGQVFSADTRNTITTGRISIALHEKKDDGSDFADVSGVLPGRSYAKHVSVENTGVEAAWVRIWVEKEFTRGGVAFDGDGALVQLDLNLGSESWIDGEDGYYYYSAPLTGGATTPELFTTVTMSGAMDETYSGADVQVKVRAEAVQYRNNESGNDVMTVTGWPTV